MPRWLLPAVVVGDVAVIAVLYAVLGWPALIVGLPLVICSVVVIVVVGVNGPYSPMPRIARAFVDASGHPRGPAGGPRPGGHGDDDWYVRTFPAGDPHPSSHDGWTTHHHSGGSHGYDSGPHGWSDPGCSDSGPSSWSDPGSSSSSDSCSSSDSGSSSSDSGSSSSSSD